MRKRVSHILTIEALLQALGIKEWEEPDDSEGWTIAYDAALKEAVLDAVDDVDDDAPMLADARERAEDCARTKADEAMAAEAHDAWRQWRNAVELIADRFFDQHGLLLDWSKEPRDGKVRIAPATTWLQAATLTMRTINGVGQFEFADVEEFMTSGPWTAREAALEHLGWIKSYASVYGDRTPQNAVYNHMR